MKKAKNSKYKKRKHRKRNQFGALIWILACVTMIVFGYCKLMNQADAQPVPANVGTWKETYSTYLQELLERNEEMEDFVKHYDQRAEYQNQKIDLSGDYTPGEVPLLMQWDKRWGYDAYGPDMIGIAGCGPTCLSMAYIYLTGDTSMNPREMAEYAYENGYYSNQGTSWSLWTEGVRGLGLYGEEVSLNENSMENALDHGAVLVCSMAPGDFTTEGHMIVIRGYDEDGFFVNDPNRKSNSRKQWTFQRLEGQIKGMWALSGNSFE